MRTNLIIPLLAAGLAGCEYVDFGENARYSQDFHYSYPLSAGGKVQVETFNGGIEISTWEENEVDISGTKFGPTTAAADALRIDVDHTAGSVSIRAVRPVEPRNHLGARFAIKVPRQAVIDRVVTSNGRIRSLSGNGPSVFRTSNGSIRIETLHGSLNAQTSNAPVELIDVEGDAIVHTSNGHIRTERLGGTLDATTSNGPIDAELDRRGGEIRAETSNGGIDLKLTAGFHAAVKARTSNGGITVRLPAEAAAHVTATTSNATVHSDFDLRGSVQSSPKHIEGDVGAGGPLVDLHTSNGSIRLLKL